MKKTIFKGVGTAIVTPFDKNGNIDYVSFKNLIEFQIENKVDAIIVCGTTGEACTLNDAEHKEAIDFVVKTVAGRVPVIAGTGSNDTAYSIELSQYAEKIGADALLLVTPYYNKTTQAGLIKHYTCIADSTSLPCILYNVPSRTGLNILPETYKTLSKHPNIVAIKEANGNISTVAKTLALCGDDIDIYSGNDDQILPILSLGGIGVISVLSNVMPLETHNLCQNFFDGNIEESRKMQIKYMDLIDSLFCEVNPIPVKYALSLMGFDVGPLRLPLCEMSEANKSRLEKSMRDLNLIK